MDNTAYRFEFVKQLNEAIERAAVSICDELPREDDDIAVLEGLRYLTRNLAHAAIVCVEGDEDYPQLVKMCSLQRQMVLPTPNALYRFATLDGKHSYTLFGRLGTARIFELEVWAGHPSDLRNFKFHSSLDHVSCRPGDEMSIRLSSTRQDGDWLSLPDGECTLMVRDYFYDWNIEQPSILTIERDGAIYPPPSLSREKLQRGLERALSWLNKTPVINRMGALQHLNSDPGEMPVQGIDIGFAKLCYTRGHYRCKDDEAVILEVRPPNTVFWDFMLSNLQWEALDYHVRQTSLNGHQAVLDSDGVFRAVISHKDPGVANWLDAGGHQLGLIAGRYYEADSKPVPKLKRVKLDDLRQHLPADTKFINTDERQKILRQRKYSMTHRLYSD